MRPNDLDRRPLLVVKCFFIPVRLRFSRVVSLTVVNFGAENRRDIRLPPLISHNCVSGSVLVVDSQLRTQRWRSLTIVISLPKPLQRSRIPARGEHRSDCILAFFDVCSHIVRLIYNTLPKVRPSRRQNLVAHGSPIYPKLVGTKRRRINTRRSNRLCDFETPTKSLNSPCGPGTSHLRAFKAGRRRHIANSFLPRRIIEFCSLPVPASVQAGAPALLPSLEKLH